MVVDPQFGVLAEWSQEQEVGAWVAALENSPTPMARLIALRQLADAEATKECVAALTAFLQDTSKPTVYRRRATTPLGELKTPEAIDALLEATKDPDYRIREAAADSLGDTLNLARVVQPLITLSRRDPAPVVRVSAIAALARLDHEGALGMIRGALEADDNSTAHVVSKHALQLLGRYGEASDTQHLVAGMHPRQPRGKRIAAAWALHTLLGRLDEDKRDSPRMRAERALLTMLDDEDIDTRSTAIGVLARAGTASGASRLRALSKSSPIPSVREDARDAASAIRKRIQGGTNKDKDSDDEEDDIHLEDRLDEMEERLKRLEEWR